VFSTTDIRKNRANLASVASRKLAEVHRLIVNGYLLVGTKRNQTREKDRGFWGEIGKDEIHWWVSKKEMDVQELKESTEKTYWSAKVLKDDSRKLKSVFVVSSYSELIDILNRFVADHEEGITALYDYVEKLRRKDVLAPSILFTYRVWGTTRQLERTVLDKSGHTAFCEDLQECLETALGTIILSKPTADWVWGDLKNQLGLDDSEFEKFIRSSKGAHRWLLLTSQRVLDQLADYLDNILQSLRNILIEIELYENVENLLNDTSFWSKVILSTLNHTIEAQLWDFKETLAMWHCHREEKPKQVTDFCENVAMFANSKGGAIVIGITDKQPRRIIGVKNPEERIKDLSDTIRKYCSYPKQFTTIQQVPMQGQNGTALCIVVAIAQTKGVVKVVDDQGRYTYPLRSQTGISRVDDKSIELSKTEVLKDNYNFISELYKISNRGFISYSYE
jgi:hypothetical protein